MSIDPRLRTAWERFLALIPVFLTIAVIGAWVLAAITLASLEHEFPTSFHADGTPRAWADPTYWWVGPAIGTMLSLFLAGALVLVRRFARTSPQYINVPAKRLFVALPVEKRLAILPRIDQLVLGFALILHFVLLAIIRDTGRMARHELTAISAWKLFVLLGLAFVWVVVGILRIRNAIRKAAASPGDSGLVSGPSDR